MKIDAHAHGMHAELDPATNKRVPPVVPAWPSKDLPDDLRRMTDRENILKLLAS